MPDRDNPEAFIVIGGQIDIIRDGQTIATVGPGEVVGELAVLGAWERTADIVAATDVELIVFDVRSFSQAMHVSDTLHQHVEQAVSARGPD